MAKSETIRGAKTPVAHISSRHTGSDHVDGNINFVPSCDARDGNRFRSRKLISTNECEDGVVHPSGTAFIAHPPDLSKPFVGSEGRSNAVTHIHVLYKTSKGGVERPIASVPAIVRARTSATSTLTGLRNSNLEEGVAGIVHSLQLAALAQVEIMAHAALVADSDDRTVASITDDVLMH